MSTDDAGGHFGSEELNALVDGHSDGAAQHLEVCPECSDRLANLRAARELVARPVPPLSEEQRAELVANALAAAHDDRTSSAVSNRARRRGMRSPVYARAAAVALIAAAAGGVVVAVRASSHSGSSAAAGAAPGLGGAATTTTNPSSARSHQTSGSPAAAQVPDVPTAQPLADAALQMRPVLGVGPAECPGPGLPLPDTEVVIPLLGRLAGGNGKCLRLGKVIVAGWRPTRLVLGSGYVLVDLTPGALGALVSAGLPELTGAAPAPGTTVPPARDWKVVALDGAAVLGDVTGFYETASSRTALVIGVDRISAERLQAQLAG